VCALCELEGFRLGRGCHRLRLYQVSGFRLIDLRATRRGKERMSWETETNRR
jgi:hypothetical protein